MNEAAEIAKQKALRAAVKAELIPFMAEFGFKKGKRNSFSQPLHYRFEGNCFQRRRDEHYDEIHILWRTLQRPLFMLEFWTSQTERMLDPKPKRSDGWPRSFTARISSGKRGWFDFFPGVESWYGTRMTVSETIATAKQRVADLDSYLRTGQPTRHLHLVSSVVMTDPPTWYSAPPS